MYVYLHTNGTYHYKQDATVDMLGPEQYFDSPFVKQYWHFESNPEARKFVIEQQKKKKES